MALSKKDQELLDACKEGNLDQAQQAVDHGALVNCLDSNGRTPVMLAIHDNNHSVTEWLLALPVNVNCGNYCGNTTLHLASEHCRNSKIVTTVATMSDNPNAVNSYGLTAVQMAVDWGNMSAVMGLLPILQIDWNAIDEVDGSLLDLARDRGHTDIAYWLTVITAVEIKTEDDVSKTKAKMQNHSNKRLIAASDEGNLLQAQQAVDGGAQVNCLDSDGRTPVMLAIENNHHSVTEWLLSLEVNVNFDDDVYGDTGDTALHRAGRKCTSEKIVTSLASRSKDVNKLNSDGQTPAQVAVKWGNVSGVLGLLVVPGVNWHLDEDGDSLLDMARKKDNKEIVELLSFLRKEDTNNNANIKKKFNEMKEAKTSFLLKIKSHKEMFAPKYLNGLAPNFKITNLGESCLEGVARDPLLGLSDTVMYMTGEEGKKKDEKTECYMNIYFKVDIQNTEKIDKIVDIFLSFMEERQKPTLLLNSAQESRINAAHKTGSTNFLVLPPTRETFEYIRQKNENHEIFDGQLSEAGVDWLSFVFGLDLTTQASMFGRKTNKNYGLGPFRDLVQYIANGGEEFIRQREEFLDMLVNLDKEEFKNKDDGNTRIIKKLKLILDSGEQLNAWMESVDTKFPLSKLKMGFNNFLCFLSFFAGLVMYSADVGTDSKFTDSMRSMSTLYNESMAYENESNCTEVVNEKWNFADQMCPNIRGDTSECLTKIEIFKVTMEKCYNKEQNRFHEDVAKWDQIFVISLVHMILPMILCILCGMVLACKTELQSCRVLDVLPVIGKGKMFILEWRKNKLMTKKKTPANDKAIKIIKNDMEKLDGSIILALLIEANSESAFQFVLQTTYRLPVLVLSGYAATHNKILYDVSLFNWRNLSIIVSFLTMAFSYYSIRNRSKKSALGPKHLVLMLCRTVLDSISRVLLLFTLMNVIEGNFNPLMVTISYYVIFLVLIFFNIIFNKSKFSCGAEYILGILLNSWSSILSYNYYDYTSLLDPEAKDKEKEKEKELHAPTLVRQILYYVLFSCLYLGLSILVVVLLQEKRSYHITDEWGVPHEVSPKTFKMLLLTSGVCHIFAGLLSIIYYMTHPSRVSVTPRGKCHLWMLGTKRDVSWRFCCQACTDEENDEDDDEDVPTSANSAQIDVEAVLPEKKNRKHSSSWCCLLDSEKDEDGSFLEQGPHEDSMSGCCDSGRACFRKERKDSRLCCCTVHSNEAYDTDDIQDTVLQTHESDCFLNTCCWGSKKRTQDDIRLQPQTSNIQKDELGVTAGDDPSGVNLEFAMIENRQEKEAEENVFPPEEEKNAGVEGFANTQEMTQDSRNVIPLQPQASKIQEDELVVVGDDPSGVNREFAMIDNREEKEAEENLFLTEVCVEKIVE